MAKLIEVFNSETHVFMAMEVFHGRELHEELRRQGRLDESRARDLFQQVGPLFSSPESILRGWRALLPLLVVFRALRALVMTPHAHMHMYIFR